MSDDDQRWTARGQEPPHPDVIETSPLPADVVAGGPMPDGMQRSHGTAPFDRLVRFAAAHSATGAPVPARANISLPPRPTSIAETGLDASLLEELALRHITTGGVMTLGEVADRLCLPLTGVVDDVVNSLRREALVEFQSSGGSIVGAANVRVRATDRGVQLDQTARQRSGYIGPAPVSFTAYVNVLRQQRAHVTAVSRSDVWRRLSHLVLADETVERIGASIESGGPILLYSASGNGKTTIGQAIARMLNGGILVPHAIELDGLIMRVFDPGVHRRLTFEASAPGIRLDERWVYCAPPFMRASSDVRMQELGLHFNLQRREYECPIQLKAAGGVLFIDDVVSRQQSSADELLLRCLEPVSDGVDHFITVTGHRVSVPLAWLLIAATDTSPADLLSERILRRFPCKVHLPGPSKEQYRELVRRACLEAGLECPPEGLEYLIERCYERPEFEPRACHAAELVRLVIATARYFGIPPQFAPRLLDVATEMYFG